MSMKSFVTVFLLASATSGAWAASLAEARGKIGEAVSDAAVLAATMSTLSPADQKAYIGEVNAAIATMPGSAESKAATFLVANRTALKSAAKGNVSDMLAETFATASLESLTVMNERFAAELFNRAADSKTTYTDEQFTAIAKKALEKIVARNAELDDGAVRDAMALMMFVRASNGTPANLQDTLIESLPESSRKAAKEEWLPAAMAEGADKSYAPLLSAVDAGQEPNVAEVVRMSGSGMLNALLADLGSGTVDADGLSPMTATTAHNANASSIAYGFTQAGGFDEGLDRVPFNFSRRIIGTDAGTHGTGRKIGDGPVYTKDWTTLQYSSGQTLVAGSKNGGTETIVVQYADGSTADIAKDGVIGGSATLIGKRDATTGEIIPITGNDMVPIVIPPGTPIAPGGTPVGPGGKPVGPGGRDIEPGGYQGQN